MCGSPRGLENGACVQQEGAGAELASLKRSQGALFV